jgi:hypothetical protein
LLAIALPIVSLAFSLLAVEAVLRWWYPVRYSTLPTIFDPQVGLLLRPGSEMQNTNYSDYSLKQRANSLGFLDREPPGPKDSGTFRILVLGDSFVEAQQVPIAEKSHVLLEDILTRRYPGRRFQTEALGRSGVGTSAELAYYEKFGRAFHADLVVVVFTHNDFGDDSPLLQSIYYGNLPGHSPWPLFQRVDSGFREIPPDSGYTRKRLETKPSPPILFGVQGHFRESSLVQWAVTVSDRRWKLSSTRQTNGVMRRLAVLRGDSNYARELAGWRYPDDLDQNNMFFAKDMPLVFQEAVANTDHAFAVLAEDARRDGFTLAVLANPECSTPPGSNPLKRELADKGQLLRLQQIGARYGFPVVDLAPEFAKRGGLKRAQWRYDSHWNTTGHRWVAEIIADFVGKDVRLGGG